MFHLCVKVIDSGFHVHLEVHIVGSDLVSIDFPRLTGFLIGISLFLLGLIAHLGFSALEGGIAHIHLIVVQVHRGLVDVGFIKIHVKVR